MALPARVVVGFRPDASRTGPVTQVRGGDVLVWAEVEFAGEGWVPFFPTPGVGSPTSAVAPPTEEVAEPEPVPAEPAAPSEPTGTPPRDDIDRAIENSEHAPASAADLADASDKPLRVRELASAVVGLAIAAYVLLAFAGPVWLRRSRSRGAPQVRIAGIWEQVVDDLARVGPPLSEGATTGDAVAHARAHAGADAEAAVAAIASAADGVAFGGITATPPLADACARHGRVLRTHLKAASAGTRKRTRAARTAGRLSPRAVRDTLAAARRHARRRKEHRAAAPNAAAVPQV